LSQSIAMILVITHDLSLSIRSDVFDPFKHV